MGFRGEICHHKPALRRFRKLQRQDGNSQHQLEKGKNLINNPARRVEQKTPVVGEAIKIPSVYSDEGKGKIYRIVVEIPFSDNSEPTVVKLPGDVISTLQ